MLNQTTTTAEPVNVYAYTYRADLDPEAATRLAQQAAKTAVRARDRVTATPFTRALMTAANLAQHSATREQAAAAAAEYLEDYADSADRATEALLHAKRLTITEDERSEYAEEYTTAAAQRDSDKAHAADIDEVLTRLSGDFDDLTGAALIQYYATIAAPATPTAALLALYGYTLEDWQSADTIPAEQREEIHSRTQYKSMIAAAGAAMNQLKALDGLDSWHTDTVPVLNAYITAHGGRAAAQAAALEYWRTRAALHSSCTAFAALDAGRAALAYLDSVTPDSVTDAEMTAAALDSWTTAHGGTGKDYRQANKDGGYTTVEQLPATKRRPAGLYRVTRRRTIRAAQSLDEMQQAGTAPAGIDSAALAALDAESANTRREYLAAVVQAASLTPRARLWVKAYCSNRAQAAAEQAGDSYAANRRKWDSNRRAAYRNAQHRAAMEYADKVLQLSPAAAQKMHKRLFARLAAAAERVKLTDSGKQHRDSRSERTSTRAAFHNRRAVQYNPAEHSYTMQQDTRRPCWIAPPDISPAAAQKLDEQTRQYFTDCATDRLHEIDNAQESTSTPAQLAKAQQEYTTRTSFASALQSRIAAHKTPSAYPALNAAEAAKYFLARMTAEEIQAHAEDEKTYREDAPARARERRAALDALKAKYPTLDEWRRMTPEQRQEWAKTH